MSWYNTSPVNIIFVQNMKNMPFFVASYVPHATQTPPPQLDFNISFGTIDMYR